MAFIQLLKRTILPPTLLVRALRLRPIEVPVRPCRVPRDAKVFMAAPALDAAVEPAVERHNLKKKKKRIYGLPHVKNTSYHFKRLASLPQIVMVMRG